MDTMRLCAPCLIWVFLISGCSSDEHEGPPVVMVIDDGFDETSQALSGHIVATYSVVCDDVALPTIDADDDLPTRRTKTLERITTRDRSCRLMPGLSKKEALLQDVEDLKERWNAAMQNDTPLASAMSHTEFLRVSAALDRDFLAKPFHGTATAGVVATQNPDVKLVLLELPLSSPEEADAEIRCIDQAALDREVEVLNDPTFRELALNRPLGMLEADTNRVEAEHHVQLVNQSFGTASLPAVQKLLAEKNCVQVNLTPLFKAHAELDELWVKKHPGVESFVVQSAGNEGVELNDSSDYSPCDIGENQVLVGSYEIHGRRSKFSNFGSCVDVFAQGEDILAPLPGGWLVPMAGTSFSAPLVTRWLVFTDEGKSVSSGERRKQLFAWRDEMNQLPQQLSVASLVYAPSGTARSFVIPGATDDRRKKTWRRSALKNARWGHSWTPSFPELRLR